jgi:hypothetical protein
MAARSTMAYLITRVRQLLRDTSSVLFSDDEDIERALDEVSWYPGRERLNYNKTQKMYISPARDYEGLVDEDAGAWSGTADPELISIYTNRTKSASTVTPDTWDLRRGRFGFTTAQSDRSLFIDAWVHDPYLAASILCGELVLEPSITPGAGETGGAIVGRFDYERAEQRYLRRAKTRPIEIKRSRENEFANY